MDVLTAPAESGEPEGGKPEPGGTHGPLSTFLRNTARAAVLGVTLLAAQADAAPVPGTRPAPATPVPTATPPAPRSPQPANPEPQPSALDAAFASELLSGSEEDPIPENPSPELIKAIRDLAAERELLDPKEANYFLNKPEDIATDLKRLRERHRELHDAPLLSDAQRFPPYDVIGEWLRFNQAYKEGLQMRLSIEPHRAEQLQEVIQECNRLWHLYDTIRDSRCSYYHITFRRQQLKRAQELLGPAAYYSGDLPAHVPASTFQPID